MRHVQSEPPSAAIKPEIAVLWYESDARCVLSWADDRFRIRLVRGSIVLKNEGATDERALFAIASQWRAEFRAAQHDSSGQRASAAPRP